MEQSITIIHVLAGRIRLRVPAILDGPEQARKLEQSAQAMTGIVSVQANELTSNVLVTYDPEIIEVDSVLSWLGSEQSKLAPSMSKELSVSYGAAEYEDAASRLMSVFVWKAAEIAAGRLISALI